MNENREMAERIMNFLHYYFDGYYMSGGGFERVTGEVEKILNGAKLDEDDNIIEEEVK